MAQPVDLTDVAQEICKQQTLRLIDKKGAGAYKETFEVSGEAGTLALKIYRPDAAPQRNEREIQAMQRCDHPGIAKLLSAGTLEIAGNTITYTLEEFLDGGTLLERLQKHGLIPYIEVKRIGGILIDSIGYLQPLRLVHRDIKPENILFRRKDDFPVITDFGIVRDLAKDSLTQSWIAQGPGTYLYSAPEQLRNEKELIDWRTDQFALGVTLAMAAFGTHPYGDGRREEIIQSVADRKDVTDEFAARGQAAGLTCLQRMVDPWPAKRYRLPDALLADWNRQEVR